ncbi:MAG TPA: cyclic pyranopterin monophosphate synthase MoaC, partial [Methanothrix sp.]|nr:cyclic pyranopterin monophosphate synthase MoaC [Methanothrix sp.]
MAEEEKLVGMVDITEKPPVIRTATARGSIKLREATLEAVRSDSVKKGDVLTVARLAAILAVKDTPRLIPLCHPIPITGLDVDFVLDEEQMSVTVTVTSLGKTGVEMEAL